MNKHGAYRNYGYGKQIHYAGKQALLDSYGQGQYATRAAHGHRWQRFVHYAKQHNINNTRKLTKEHIEAYAQYLQTEVIDGRLSLRYAHNLLSTVNVVLSIMRQDKALHLSPKQWLGQRRHVRTQAPKSLNATHYAQVIKTLQQQGKHDIALMAELARYLGVRIKEAALLNLPLAYKQMHTQQQVNITEGTKGGRGKRVDRWVPINTHNQRLLSQIKHYLQHHPQSKNLIPKDMTLQQWRDHCYLHWNQANQDVAKQVGYSEQDSQAYAIKGFHDLRAAYACERYQQLTGYLAPVVHPEQQRTAPKSIDQDARQILAHAIGHSRIHIMVSYIGSSQ